MGLFKKIGGRLIDVRVDKWMSLDYVGDTAERFKTLFFSIVTPSKASMAETFEEAMQRLELDERDLIQRKKEFTRLCYFFLFLATSILCYAIYLGYQGNLTASLIAFCLTLYSLTQAFRFHFWLFQLRHRKLGCSIKEWMNSELYSAPSRSLTTQDSEQALDRNNETTNRDPE